MQRLMFRAGVSLLALLAMPLAAKPIAYADGKTVMVEYGAGTMYEAQAYYAPRAWWSAGVDAIELHSEDGKAQRRIVTARVNLLAKRWNLPGAQANVFVWGGLGQATGNDFAGSTLARDVGFETDYETRRVYASLRSDLQESDHYSHRIDTIQLGWAPYKHDYDTLATWIVVQGRHYTRGLFRGTEKAVLLRLFKGGTWVEAGVTTDGKPQVMAMFNF